MTIMGMFVTDKNTVIYVICPYYFKTGGTELAHQLVKCLNDKGKRSMIAYYGIADKDKGINPAFEKYVHEYVDIHDIEDKKENVVILPEIAPNLMDGTKNIQKAVWWMSVDNFYNNSMAVQYYHAFGVWRTAGWFLKGNLFRTKKVDKKIVHLYQSEYAHQFLVDNGIKVMHRLSDYINRDYMTAEDVEHADREDIVLYNPSKGFEFTKTLMECAPDINWTPICNMSNRELRELMKKSKLYVDFGNHPGKDRLPRETAIMGCCIITGTDGAAGFYEDIPISDYYKFEARKDNIDNVIERVRECLSNYDVRINDFEKYRNVIRAEYELFCEDTEAIFL